MVEPDQCLCRSVLSLNCSAHLGRGETLGGEAHERAFGQGDGETGVCGVFPKQVEPRPKAQRSSWSWEGELGSWVHDEGRALPRLTGAAQSEWRPRAGATQVHSGQEKAGGRAGTCSCKGHCGPSPGAWLPRASPLLLEWVLEPPTLETPWQRWWGDWGTRRSNWASCESSCGRGFVSHPLQTQKGPHLMDLQLGWDFKACLPPQHPDLPRGPSSS